MSRPRSGSRRGYAAGLDGIRALAVFAVVAYHAGVPFLPGGYLGVDLFFVVSGYLITALLQREHDRTGGIALRSFWARRARRLLPVLVLMLITVCALSLALGHDLGAGLRGQLLVALTFSSNWWQIASGSSYVEAMEPSMLTHLWSLAVEEQFYLIWPFVVLVLLTFVANRRLRRTLVVLLGLASAAAMIIGYPGFGDPTRVYVGTDTHGFGLLLGAALAFARTTSEIDPRRGLRRMATGSAGWIGPVSLLVVLAGMAVLAFDSPATFRGGLLVVNIAAVGLVAAAVRGTGPIHTLMAHRWLRPWGLRSYSLYLWHWPALVITQRLLAAELGGPTAALIGVVAALIATEISWRLVEDPIRRLGFGGYLNSIRRLLVVPGRARPARRSAGWLAAGAFGVALATAACGVVVAPTASTLKVSLAAGREALAQTSSQPAEPEIDDEEPVPTSPPTVITVGPVESSDAAEPSATASGRASTTGSPVVGTSRTPGTKPLPTSAPPRPSSSATRSQPVPTPTSSAAPTVKGRQVKMIGDSVMLAAAPALLSSLPGVDIDAAVSRQLWDLPGLLGFSKRPYVVIGLGTNGVESVEGLRHLLSVLPQSTVVVLVNTFGPQRWQDETNTNLAAVAADRPHTCVADWHKAITGHRDLLAGDGIHPGPAAAQLYADVIKSALSGCR